MTKIEAYRAAKLVYDALVELHARSKDPQTWDKFGANVMIENSYQGTYGHSGCSPWPRDLTTRIGNAICTHWPTAIAWAVSEAKAQMERARHDAESEARDVLKAVQP